MSEDVQKSDLARAFAEDGEIKTHVGGQALLEGIMMRGKYNWAVAVREPDGNIYIEEHDLVSGKKKHSWMGWPFVRGCTALVESLALGFKALEIAAEHAFQMTMSVNALRKRLTLSLRRWRSSSTLDKMRLARML